LETKKVSNAPIPLVDLKTQSQALKHDILEAIGNVIDSAGYILGKEVELFEEEFAEYCGAKYAVGVANGTDALHLALRALEIGAGDEVITAGNSFAATSLAIAYSGAEAVLVDIDEEDFCIDVDLIEQAITRRTKAIMPVHLYGQPAKMTRIREIAEKHSLAIVEDAAQAHAAEYKGQRAGSLGTIGCFSFYPGKNLGAFGDGGAVVTNDTALANKIRLLRNYGQVRKNEHSMLGFNCRLDTVQAAVLLVKLGHLDKWTDARRRVAAKYNELLAGSDLRLPIERSDAKHVYHLYVVRHPDRDRLIEELADDKIFCGVHYPHPLNRAQPFVNSPTIPNGLPVCSRVAGEIMSLPMYPEMTDEQVARVVDCLVSCSTPSR
jgi:dTDP-4-amino-4,6-dideoxygalactose transaminase